MPLVPAKCTICGAVLNIDSSKEASVCQSCGNAFVVEKAINHYNTYNSVVNNITSDNVVVHIESEKERLNTSAETYIKLGDIRRALASYRELVDKFPDDWRGWWGTIYYQYGYEVLHILHGSIGRFELQQKMMLFKKIAPPEEYDKLDNVIKSRIAEVDAQIAQEKAEKTEILKRSADETIMALTQQIEDTTKNLSDARQNCDKVQDEWELSVRKKEVLEERNRKYKGQKDALENMPYLGVVGAIIFGILGLIDGTEFFLVLVVCGLLGAAAYGILLFVSCIISALLPSKTLTKELQEATQAESSAKSSVDNLRYSVGKLEAQLEQCKRVRSYLQENKDFIVASMSSCDRVDINAFVKEQMEQK